MTQRTDLYIILTKNKQVMKYNASIYKLKLTAWSTTALKFVLNGYISRTREAASREKTQLLTTLCSIYGVPHKFLSAIQI